MDLNQIELFYRFGAALVIGLLIGLQREYAKGHVEEEDLFAGARTFTLLSLAGAAGSYLEMQMGSNFLLVAVILVLGAMIVMAYYVGSSDGAIGQTTEVAAVVTIIAGALCIAGDLSIAVAIGVATTVLLSLKLQTESFAEHLTREDVYSTLKFLVITAIILPVLPRRGYGPPPFDALVPFQIWLMVVFISGISFLGYILIKLVGTRKGVGLTGILGGLASSTAVTLSFAQKSRGRETLAGTFAMAILLAWAIMFVRVLVETAAINPVLFKSVWIPLVSAMAVVLAFCAYLFNSDESKNYQDPDEFTNPFKLGPALTFGLLYGVIFLLANTAKLYFGSTGIYASSIVSGLVDVDAITLSMAELSRDEGLSIETARRAVVLATASNTMVKGGIVLVTGSPRLRKVILPGLLLSVAVAVGIVFTL